MNTAQSLPAPLLLGATASASAFLLLACLMPPCHAQSPAQFPPPAPAQNPPAVLPAGVDRLYALEGTNTILAMATPEGYDRLRELVRNLDGDLDIIQTKVVSVEARTTDLTALGVSIPPGTTSLSGSDGARLRAALQNGDLRPIETLRITTREDTPVDTLLRHAGARHATGGTPFTLIPREEKDGTVTLEIPQPLSVQVAVQSGQTAVLALPEMTPGTVRLLFLTPSVLSSESRPVR